MQHSETWSKSAVLRDVDSDERIGKMSLQEAVKNLVSTGKKSLLI